MSDIFTLALFPYNMNRIYLIENMFSLLHASRIKCLKLTDNQKMVSFRKSPTKESKFYITTFKTNDSMIYRLLIYAHSFLTLQVEMPHML